MFLFRAFVALTLSVMVVASPIHRAVGPRPPMGTHIPDGAGTARVAHLEAGQAIGPGPGNPLHPHRNGGLLLPPQTYSKQVPADGDE